MILALYAGEDQQEVFNDLNNLYKKHPREVEFYIPQLCTYLFHFSQMRIDKQKTEGTPSESQAQLADATQDQEQIVDANEQKAGNALKEFLI